MKQGVLDKGWDLCFCIQRCKRSVNGGRTPLRGSFPQAPFFLAARTLREFRSLRRATRALPSTREGLKCGICGEHGGDPASVKFCHKIGLNYVSCSPFRVPIARLAAAQAAIEDEK